MSFEQLFLVFNWHVVAPLKGSDITEERRVPVAHSLRTVAARKFTAGEKQQSFVWNKFCSERQLCPITEATSVKTRQTQGRRNRN